jgi:dCMP deaminase
MNRPTWDEIWMSVARIIARRSIDPRRKVGAAIVNADGTQVLSVGYNGDYRGGPNIVESEEPGESGTIHAEINALIKLDYNYPQRKIMYLTLSPCRMCAKAIVNARIDEVVYDIQYRDATGLDILCNAGVKVRKFPSDDNI